MPFSNKPPSSTLSAKKQQSIASFFTPGGVAGVSKPPTVHSKSSQEENEGTASHLNGNGAILGRDKRRGVIQEEEDELPVRKRQKSGQGAEVNGNSSGFQPIEQESQFGIQADFGTQDGAVSRGGLFAAAAKGPRHGRKPSERTSKYLFNNAGQSRTQEEHNDESDLSEGERQEKAKRHRDFVRKLGKPESFADLRRRNLIIPDEVAEELPNEADDMADGDADGQAPESKNRKAPRKGSGAKALTPMEKQVLEIKAKHKDTLLIVEVGYKFRFFGEDARIAAKELRIVCIPGKMRFDEHISEAHLDRFASASVPVHRLHVHVKRLVTAGYKVGVVRQLETAALKAAGDNKGGPFVRKLTNVYTKGTYIDDIEGLDEPLDSPKGGAPATGYLLSITETKAKGWGNDEKVHVGIVAVQPATGDVIYDDFEDGFMRSEIETRILHIAPCEFLIVGELSKATSKLIEHLSGSAMNVFGDKIRVERVPKGKTMAAESYSHLANFYAGKLKESHGQADENPGRLLDKVLNLAEHVTVCLSAMIKHMSEYGLEHVFDLTKYFQSFSARSHMLLNGNTLTSLEIYLNQTDKSEKGSLFWSLDRTRTRFGQRLLRRWVGRPLLEKARLVERIKAVEELTESHSIILVDRLKNLLSSVKSDLEKSLIRIYYGKCSRPELLTVLQTLQRISNAFATVKSPSEAGFRSDIINHAVAKLPTIASVVTNHLDKINSGAARSNDKYNFFLEAEENSTITERKEAINVIEEQLDDHRLEAAKKVGLKQVEYVTVAGIEYLIELENNQTKKIPASWAKISGTKKVSRWHTPEVIRLLREREQNKEALAAACDLAFKSLLAEIAEDYQSFRDCVQSLAMLDCLLSLSVIASQPGYVKPEYVNDTLIEVKAGRHPMVEQLLLDSYVPNDINLSSRNTRALLITGPNMGGKSSYVRQVALIAIMGQIGSYVPADSAKLGMFDAVFTRMGAFDNMMAGESTFMVELSETSDILKQATPRSLVILDELGRGTSTHDGVAIAEGVLDYMVRDLKCITLFITHYQTLSTVANGYENDELKNVHMRFTEDGQDGQDITFLYEVGEGVAHRSYGLNVARLAKVPKSVLDTAAIKSKELEDVVQMKKLTSLSRNIPAVLHTGDMDQFELLAKGIEQL